MVRRANEKYGAANVSLTGHSLGGTKALHAQVAQNNHTVVFNPGASPLGEKVAKKDTVRIVRNAGDTISLGYAASADNRVSEQSLYNSMFPTFLPVRAYNEYNAHKLSQFY